MSAAVHHSAYLIATDEANGGSAILAAVMEVPNATSGVPTAAIGKGTAGVSRQPEAIIAKVGVPHREYPNGNILVVRHLHFHGEGPLLAKRNSVGHNPNTGMCIWLAYCGDHSAARRDFQGVVAAVWTVVKESLQCGTKKKKNKKTKAFITRLI